MASSKSTHHCFLRSIAKYIIVANMAARPTSAVARVYGVTELLEKILFELPNKDLLLS
jgi:hypothetical protein